MTNKTINLTPGETLSLNGHQLRGDTVTLTDTSVGGLTTETVDVTGTVTLSGMRMATDNLHFAGGTLNFVGTSTFSGNEFTTGTTVFDDNLTGTGTLDLGGGDHDGSAVEVKGSVGAGLTFALNVDSAAPTMSLQIDDPAKFHGLIALPAATPSLFDFVAFMGLHATSADLSHDMLQVFNGNKLVDSVRVSGGGTNLQLEQNSQGIMLSAAFAENQPGGAGTIIPLHVA
jgi:hypothetical protein